MLPRTVLTVVVIAASYAFAITTYSVLHGGWRPHRVETAWLVFGILLVAWLLACALRRGSDAGVTRRSVRDEGRARRIVVSACVVTAIIYAPALGLGWLSDDFVLLDLSRGPGLTLG